jgi:hypothetical protein
MAGFQRLKRQEGEPGLIVHSGGYILADMVSDGEFEKALEPTDHAIEDGSSISDHVIRKPLTGSLTLVQTQTPIEPTEGFSRKAIEIAAAVPKQRKQTVRLNVRQKLGFQPNAAALISAGLNALKGATEGPQTIEGVKVQKPEKQSFSVTVFSADAPVDRLNEFNALLWALLESTELVTVNFKGRAYPNLLLTSVRRTDAAGQFGRATFACSFREIIKVQVKQVTLPAVPKQRSKKSLGAIKPYGDQFGPPPPPENRTFAAQIADGGMSLAR